jgi:hypothetical protein
LIEEIILPDNVQEVHNNAFEGCDRLETLSPLWVDMKFATRNGSSDFEIRNNCIVKYKGNASRVKIPYGITEIGCDAFYDCSGLRSIIIPGSVTKISGGAFSGCQSLTSLVIPDSVTEIEAYGDNGWHDYDKTFHNCKSLKKVILKGSNKEKLLALRKRLLDINSNFEISFEI